MSRAAPLAGRGRLAAGEQETPGCNAILPLSANLIALLIADIRIPGFPPSVGDRGAGPARSGGLPGEGLINPRLNLSPF
ncbi:MAG: hypothetical protein A2W25_09630 [candidate division Zixibacteria bacterium RBG_16_53_22]|nr:MAG: hypothetical protein A2W25_09630 [candidate division Zixibacteria bacterium RBG_16_53_22]